MATLLIRKIDAPLHARIKARAKRHGRSLEEEARELLRLAVAAQDAAAPEPLGELARRLFEPLGGVELDLPARQSVPERSPPDFSAADFAGWSCWTPTSSRN